MKQEIPLWWRDVNRSVSQAVTRCELAAARLEAFFAETSDGESAVPNSRGWESLLAEVKTAGGQVARSLALASSRRRDVETLGLIPPSSQELTDQARAISAKLHTISALMRKRLARIRNELRQMDRPRNRQDTNAFPSQIDVHV